jgi:hydroxymethylpyrimidine pyrophosphatase-like HAD family hydrolase
MKLSVVALDYDGTISDAAGQLDGTVRKSIVELRSRGIVVLIVTGRRLEHLREGIGDLGVVDAVIAENGAVVAFPASGRTMSLGRPLSQDFIKELEANALPFVTGESVVEMEAIYAEAALTIIRRLQLPLVLLFNRDRLMVLPQSVSKGTGLREALAAMRLSPHNTLAVGDAENDHELLAVAELGAAVAWGSAALQCAADEVIAGDGPPAVAAYLMDVAARPRLTSRNKGKRPLILGRDISERMLALHVPDRNVLIAGDPRSGKSWIAGLLAEQLIIQRYSVCIIDPEGDYRGLETLPGVLLFGGDDPPPRPRELMQALRNADFSTVIDLSKLPFDQKRDYVTQLLAMLNILRRQTGLPHRIVIDEAHYFFDDSNAKRLIDFELAGYTIITYRLSQLPRAVVSGTEAVILTRHTDRHEVEALRSLPGAQSVDARMLSNLRVDQAVLLGGIEESPEAPVRFEIAPRLTFHVRHQHKYLDVPVSERHAFVFRQNGKTGKRVRSFREFSDAIATTPMQALAGHLSRNDFSRWIGDVFGDRPLAAQVRDVERRYQLGPTADVNDELLQLLRDRYTCDQSADADVRLKAST